MSSILQKANDLIEEYGSVENYFKSRERDNRHLNMSELKALHKIKTHPIPFAAVQHLNKTFEIRFNDRMYKIGDELLLEEFEPKDYWGPGQPKENRYTGEILHRVITYVLDGGQYGIEMGYVVLAIEKI